MSFPSSLSFPTHLLLLLCCLSVSGVSHHHPVLVQASASADLHRIIWPASWSEVIIAHVPQTLQGSFLPHSHSEVHCALSSSPTPAVTQFPPQRASLVLGPFCSLLRLSEVQFGRSVKTLNFSVRLRSCVSLQLQDLKGHCSSGWQRPVLCESTDHFLG